MSASLTLSNVYRPRWMPNLQAWLFGLLILCFVASLFMSREATNNLLWVFLVVWVAIVIFGVMQLRRQRKLHLTLRRPLSEMVAAANQPWSVKSVRNQLRSYDHYWGLGLDEAALLKQFSLRTYGRPFNYDEAEHLAFLIRNVSTTGGWGSLALKVKELGVDNDSAILMAARIEGYLYGAMHPQGVGALMLHEVPVEPFIAFLQRPDLGLPIDMKLD